MIEVLRADITTLAVDAIVNAANESLRGGGGVDGAIHSAAGPELLQECRRLPECPTGSAVLTKGFRLKARYVIHAVGPVWHGGSRDEPALLERAYRSVFTAALEHGDIRSLAFPSISTGVYGFPKREAAAIAVGVMRDHETHFDRIIACVFGSEDETVYQEVLGESRYPRHG